jgi:hypothetical protein
VNAIFKIYLERRLEKEVEAGRRKVSEMKTKLEQQAEHLSQARLQLDRGHRHRDDSQVQKLLQVMLLLLANLPED